MSGQNGLVRPDWSGPTGRAVRRYPRNSRGSRGGACSSEKLPDDCGELLRLFDLRHVTGPREDVPFGTGQGRDRRIVVEKRKHVVVIPPRHQDRYSERAQGAEQ